MTKNNTSETAQNTSHFDQVGQVAFVDFYFDGFSEDAKEVTLKVGREYTIKAKIGNICDKREFNWLIWGATPTSPTSQEAKVKFNQVGVFTIELMLRTSHVGGGSVCSSNGQKRKENYVRVVK
jgi:hypothetical protein